MCIVTTLSNNIKRLRAERGWTQETLANETDLARGYLGKVEHGDYNVGILTIDKIAHAFNVPISSLLEEQGENNETTTENLHEKSS